MAASVTATPAALELIERLSAREGPLVFHQSGGCCDGSSPMCLRREELPPSRYDILLGQLAGHPFYIDSELYTRWGSPEFVIDVAPGAGEGFSIEASDDLHFVARTTRRAGSGTRSARGSGRQAVTLARGTS